MSQMKPVILSLLFITFLVGVGFYTLDSLGIIQASDTFTFLAPKNPKVVQDNEYPTEVDKLQMKKLEDKLREKEEKLASREDEIKKNETDLKQKLGDLDEVKKDLLAQRKKLSSMMKDFSGRKDKIKDMANKVANMPPIKAQEMMQNWSDFDIIEVLRQMDKQAQIDGTISITPYLLTLFVPKRRAAITRKMLLPSLIDESDSSDNTDDTSIN